MTSPGQAWVLFSGFQKVQGTDEEPNCGFHSAYGNWLDSNLLTDIVALQTLFLRDTCIVICYHLL